MRIGIFGGSFDPIHQGHLILAENCREQARLDEVWFLPCARQPLKAQAPQATDRQRCEMIEFALAGHSDFKLEKIELDRAQDQEASYTVDTLEQLSNKHLGDEFFLLMGDDSLESFFRWKDPQRICELAAIVVVNRPGSGDVDLNPLSELVSAERFKLFESLRTSSPQIEISSSNIRERIQSGKTTRYLLPRAVQKFIETQNLYHS